MQLVVKHGWLVQEPVSCTTLLSDDVFARRLQRPFDKICVLCACNIRLEGLWKQALSADEEGWGKEHGAGVVLYIPHPAGAAS